VEANGPAKGYTDTEVVVAVFIKWGDGHQSDTSLSMTTTLNRILDAVLDFVYRVLITVGRTITMYCPECPEPVK